METTVQVLHLLLIGFGLAIGYWTGVIKEKDRQERKQRANLRTRYGHPSNR